MRIVKSLLTRIKNFNFEMASSDRPDCNYTPNIIEMFSGCKGEANYGGVKMKAMSTYPIEYLKVHLAYDEIKTAVRSSIFKKAREAKEYLVASVVAVLLCSLFIVAFVRLSNCNDITACCCDKIYEKNFVQLIQ